MIALGVLVAIGTLGIGVLFSIAFFAGGIGLLYLSSRLSEMREDAQDQYEIEAQKNRRQGARKDLSSNHSPQGTYVSRTSFQIVNEETADNDGIGDNRNIADGYRENPPSDHSLQRTYASRASFQTVG